MKTNSSTNELDHMTKMATMPIYGKNLKNLLLLNQLASGLGTKFYLHIL